MLLAFSECKKKTISKHRLRQEEGENAPQPEIKQLTKSQADLRVEIEQTNL